MQQIPLSDFLNQLYMFRATNEPILRRTFLTLYTAFGTVRYLLQTGALYQNLYIQSKSSSGIYSFRYNAPIFTADRCIVPKYVHTVKKFFWYIQLSVQCTDIYCRPVHCTKICTYSQKVLLVYTAFGTMHRYLLQTGALYQKLYIQSKVLLRNGEFVAQSMSG